MLRKCLIGLAVLVVIGTGSAFAANSLAVTAGGAAGSDFKLEVICDGSSNNVFVQSNHPTGESHYLIRFWMNPALLNLTANQSIRIGAIGDNVQGQHVLLFMKRNMADNSFRLNTWYNTDTGPYTAGPGVFLMLQTNQNQWRQVEVEFTAGTAPGSNDGELVVRRIAPTAASASVTGLNTSQRGVDNFRWGSLAGTCASGNGAFYLDEFESYR
jgi:hypothetical protein